MSFTITLTGSSSFISHDFDVPIYLNEDPSVQYEIGLVNFDTFNMIPNVDQTNNVLVWGINDEFKVNIPSGSYEVDDIIDEIKRNIALLDDTAVIDIVPNKHTYRVVMTTNRKINFQVENSIGSLLGYKNKILEANKSHESDEEVRILKTNTICVDCNLAVGSYLNSKPVHIIHQFFPTVPYGYKIVEVPQNIIYYPVSDKSVNNITVKLIDQAGNLINFRGEEITIRLHIRQQL